MHRFSKLEKMIRVFALCLRLRDHLPRIRKNLANKNNPHIPPEIRKNSRVITVSELQDARQICILISQSTDFSQEIIALQRGKEINKGNSMVRLAPFLDKMGIIRVGGRLHNSNLSFNDKHPPIISGNSQLGKLIIDWGHRMALHGEFRVTNVYVMRQAWLVRGTVCIKSHVHKCLICAKIRAKITS